MSQKNLNGFFFPAVAGLFFFMNRPKAEDVYRVEPEYPVFKKDESGLTGVAKYLDKQNTALITIETQDDTTQPVSGVAKYLDNLAKIHSTGVSKYVLRQSIAEKQKKETLGKNEATGVEKYLKNQKPAPGLSGVAKYLKHQDSLPQPSNVAKYIAKQAALNSLQVKPVEAKISGVAKYLHKITGTGVSRYINTQEKVSESTKLTGVDKYVANQPQQSSAKAVTGVDKYVRDRG